MKQSGGFFGGFWFAGWLFTIGFMKLSFWQGVFALIIWPYYIGTWVAALPGVLPS